MSKSTVEIDQRILSDSAEVATLLVCQVRLMDDARFPWLLLVPRRHAVELADLSALDRTSVIDEIAAASNAIRQVAGSVDKLNVGQLGNLVPQLHIHVVGRRRGDPAWPGPVWGAGTRVPYFDAERDRLVGLYRQALAENGRRRMGG